MKRLLALEKVIQALQFITKTSRFSPIFAPQIEELLNAINQLKKTEDSIDIKIKKVSDSLNETSKILKELETEFIQRSINLDKLMQEYGKYSKLAEIEKEKASALLEQVDHSVNKGKTIERWIAFWISIISGLIIFILGLILSPMLTSFFLNLFK